MLGMSRHGWRNAGNVSPWMAECLKRRSDFPSSVRYGRSQTMRFVAMRHRRQAAACKDRYNCPAENCNLRTACCVHSHVAAATFARGTRCALSSCCCCSRCRHSWLAALPTQRHPSRSASRSARITTTRPRPSNRRRRLALCLRARPPLRVLQSPRRLRRPPVQEAQRRSKRAVAHRA